MAKKKSKTTPTNTSGPRNYQPKQRQGIRVNADGSVSSHLMKREQLEDGSWVAFPSLFQDDDGTWVDKGIEYGDNWKPIYDEAVKRGEVYNFGEDVDGAIDFADNGSWKPQYAGGGKFGDALKLTGDTLLSTIGLTDVIGDNAYKNQGMADASRVGEKIGLGVGKTVGNALLPGVGGQLVSTGQNMLGNIDGEDSERARIEQMRLNPEAYGKYAGSIGQMNNAINPLAVGADIAGNVGSSLVGGGFGQVKDMIGNGLENRAINKLGDKAFRAYGGNINMPKYQTGGPITMGEQVIPGSDRHKELQAMEAARAPYLAQQDYIKSLGLDLNQTSRADIEKNFKGLKDTIPDDAGVAYSLPNNIEGAEGYNNDKLGVRLFSDPKSNQAFLSGLADPGEVPDYDLAPDDIDMSIEPEKGMYKFNAQMQNNGLVNPSNPNEVMPRSGNTTTGTAGTYYGYEGLPEEFFPTDEYKNYLPSEANARDIQSGNLDFGAYNKTIDENTYVSGLNPELWDREKSARRSATGLGAGSIPTSNQLPGQNILPATFAYGGKVNHMSDGGKFVEYEGPTHAGGGIDVNQSGIPTNGPATAEVEGGETMHDNGIESYIFSDRLVLNPGEKKKKTFADESKKINRKYKNSENDKIAEDSRKMELEALKQEQESLKQMMNGGDEQQPSNQFPDGGQVNPNAYNIKNGNTYIDTTATQTNMPTLPAGVGIPGSIGGNNKMPDLPKGTGWDAKYKDLNPQQKKAVDKYIELSNSTYRANQAAARTSHYEAPWYNTDTRDMNNGNAAMFNKLDSEANAIRKQYPELSSFFLSSTNITDGGIIKISDDKRYSYGGNLPQFYNGGVVPDPFVGNQLSQGVLGTNPYTNPVHNGIGNDAYFAHTQLPNINYEQQATQGTGPSWEDITKGLSSQEYGNLDNTQGKGYYDNTMAGQLPQDTINPLGFGASNIGNLYDLTQSAKETKANDFGQMDPNLVNYEAQREEARKQAGVSQAIARENSRNSSSAGGAMTNQVISNALISSGLGSQLSQSYMGEANTNAQIKNQAEQVNTNIEMQEEIANQQDLANRKSVTSQALHGIGMNTQGYVKDLKAADVGNMNNKMWYDLVSEGKYTKYLTQADGTQKMVINIDGKYYDPTNQKELNKDGSKKN